MRCKRFLTPLVCAALLFSLAAGGAGGVLSAAAASSSSGTSASSAPGASSKTPTTGDLQNQVNSPVVGVLLDAQIGRAHV